MIIYPPLTELMKRDDIDSRYALVIATAKYARMLCNNAGQTLHNFETDKPVAMAATAIYKGLVSILPASDNSDAFVEYFDAQE
ncbi:MAG: DNA-directed RNA polymerase subunit omega [Clostridiales bacterium]|jgi:DNA-directed RNA polymerase omega subunit|nr:DNA-directed RNA polymerase subunit omega [Clostridiales bacterium]